MKRKTLKILKNILVPFQVTFIVACYLLSARTSYAQVREPSDKLLIGNWLGSLNNEVHVYYEISRKWDGSLMGYNGIIEFKMSGGPVEVVTLVRDSVYFRELESNQRYSGILNSDSMIIRGSYTNLNINQSWTRTLKLVDHFPVFVRPQTPLRLFPYKEENVVYENKTAGIHLAGTLTLLDTKGPFPAAILITGSGQQNRDYEHSFHRPFLVLADFLTRQGIAVLRVDDRGVGGTTRTGPFFNSTTKDFASDVLAGVQYLRTRKEIDPGRIGLIGHSEGGLIASMLAADSPEIAFIVLMASPAGGKFSKGIVAQDSVTAIAGGANEQETAVIVNWCKCYYSIALNEKDTHIAREKLQQLFDERTPEEKQAFEKTGVAGGTLSIDYALQPHFQYLCSIAPNDYLRRVKCPVLALMGDKDVSGPCTFTLKNMEDMFKAAGNKNYAIHEMKNMNHFFQSVNPDNIRNSEDIDETISPLVLDLIGSWVKDQMFKR
ncbi:MAG: alpha/beta hydrolase [Bacteroidia bacterium]|nr:alpha/beta hydrolase [Bacteroidia bacterium]